MTPQQLRDLREARNLTREELAAELRCAAGSIVNWEHGLRAIPNWVEEKMLSGARITLPLDELAQLLDYCRTQQLDFNDVLREAIMSYIAPEKAAEAAPNVKPIKYGRDTKPDPDLKVADELTAAKRPWRKKGA